MNQSGAGRPAVVLEAGIAASSLSWSILQPQLAFLTSTYSYDRAGLGWSTSTGRRCSLEQMADELHQWIQAAEVPTPYLLAGHSYAAYILRVYAKRFQREIAGMILVDPLTPEEWLEPDRAQRWQLRRAVWFCRAGAVVSGLGILRFCLWLLQQGRNSVPRRVLSGFGPSARSTVERILGELAKLPPHTVRLIRERWGHPSFFLVMARYIQSLPVCAREAARHLLHPEIPVTVISGAQQPPGRLAEQRALAAQSRRGRHIIADKGAHWIQLDQPELIVAAYREMAAMIGEDAIPASHHA